MNSPQSTGRQAAAVGLLIGVIISLGIVVTSWLVFEGASTYGLSQGSGEIDSDLPRAEERQNLLRPSQMRGLTLRADRHESINLVIYDTDSKREIEYRRMSVVLRGSEGQVLAELPMSIGKEGKLDWQELETALLEYCALLYSVEFGIPGYCSRELQLKELYSVAASRTPGIGFRRGGELRMRIVSPAGIPVRDVRIRIEGPESSDQSRELRGTTDYKGEVILDGGPGCLPEGIYRIRQEVLEGLFLRPEIIEHRYGVSHELTALPSARLRGVCVDSDGTPLAGVTVVPNILSNPARNHEWVYTERTVTDRSGGFVLYANAGDVLADTELWTYGEQTVPEKHKGPFKWNGGGTILEVDEYITARIRVVDSSGGDPIERYSVALAPLVWLYDSQTQPRLGGYHENGELRIDKVAPGKNWLCVFPEEHEHTLRGPLLVTFEEDREDRVYEVELDRAEKVEVLFTSNDRSLVGTSCKLWIVRSVADDPLDLALPTEDAIIAGDEWSLIISSWELEIGHTEQVFVPIEEDSIGYCLVSSEGDVITSGSLSLILDGGVVVD